LSVFCSFSVGVVPFALSKGPLLPRLTGAHGPRSAAVGQTAELATQRCTLVRPIHVRVKEKTREWRQLIAVLAVLCLMRSVFETVKRRRQ
jgi:hypothetical protein